jgi:probable F420-dependent oxidoreductase
MDGALSPARWDSHERHPTVTHPPLYLGETVDLGLFLFYSDESAPLSEIAKTAEEAGFESIWVPEHTHIPADPLITMPTGTPLPRPYPRLYDPFVLLASIAAVTTRVRLGTGIALAAHHDPITLAKTCATVDRLSNGRLILGVGAGHIRQEIENHGVDFDSRWSRAVEHVAAMRAIWAHDEASFEGRWVSFGPIWSWPKPVNGTIPVLFGTLGPSRLVARHADGWLPLSITQAGELPAAIDLLKRRRSEAGRAADALDVTAMCLEPMTVDGVRELEAAGVTRVVLRPRSNKTTEQIAEFVERYRELIDPAPVARAAGR